MQVRCVLLLLGSAYYTTDTVVVEQRAAVRAAVAEGLLQNQSGKPTGAARAEIAGLGSHVCVKTCTGCAVCTGAGTWMYLYVNISVQSKRYSWVSEVLSVYKVKTVQGRVQKRT